MKNNMRTIKEKEDIVKELLNGKLSWREISEKYNLSYSVLFRWEKNYLSKGIEGLKSNTGKHSSQGLHLRKPKNKIEELEIIKKDIEIYW